MKNLFEQDAVVNRAELLARLGKTDRTVRRWLAQGLPRRPDGRFDLREVGRWLENRGSAREGPPPAPGEEMSKHHWDRVNAELRAKMREMEYRQKAGELVELEAVRKFAAHNREICKRCVLNVRDAFLALSRKIAPVLAGRPPRECFAVLDEEVRLILNGLAAGQQFTIISGGQEITVDMGGACGK